MRLLVLVLALASTVTALTIVNNCNSDDDRATISIGTINFGRPPQLFECSSLVPFLPGETVAFAFCSGGLESSLNTGKTLSSGKTP